MGKKKLAKTALSAALVGSMILGNAASVYAWTTSDEVSDRAISLEAAGEGMVLLENNGTLPVKKGAKVVVYGGGHWQRSKEEPVPVM